MFCYGLGRLVRIPALVCFAFPLLMEVTSWFYIKHVLKVNAKAEKHSIGVMEQWINYRDVIQFNRHFSSFSPALGYTLRPDSEGYHKDLEFNNRFKINSFGLRDDDISLANPKIVFLGDSFTMGWGIDQEKTFAQLTEQMTGARALNAGISSYGTYREMLLLSKLQLDSCKLLVIQYCDNDLEENAARNASPRQSQFLTAKRFEKVGVFNRLNEGYFPLRYTYFFVREKDLFKRIFTEPANVLSDARIAFGAWAAGKQMQAQPPVSSKTNADAERHSDNFFKVLAKIRNIYKGNIVVMHIDERYTKPMLMDSFENSAKSLQDNKLHFLRACDLLQTKDYYPIDGHLNASGQRKIAMELTEMIRSKRLLE
jgi:lysophospholipase L1-like esterase